MASQANSNNVRHIAQVLADFKEELKDFANTRYQMLRAEIGEKVRAWKAGIPMVIVGVLLLATAWLLFTAGLVILVAVLLPESQWTVLGAVLLVMLGYAIVGTIMGMAGWRSMTKQGVTPDRTLRVLKQDQLWFQAEARTQL